MNSADSYVKRYGIIIAIAAFVAFSGAYVLAEESDAETVIPDYVSDGIGYKLNKWSSSASVVSYTNSDDRTEVIIPSSIVTIDKNGVETRYTVSEIGSGAFNGSNLISVTVPDSVNKVGSSLFTNSVNLKNVFWNASAGIDCNYGSRNHSFDGCTSGVTVTFNGENGIVPSFATGRDGCVKNLTNVIIGENIKIISSKAFQYLNVEKLIIPANVEKMGGQVFWKANTGECVFEGNDIELIVDSGTFGNIFFYSNEGVPVDKIVCNDTIGKKLFVYNRVSGLGIEDTVVENDGVYTIVKKLTPQSFDMSGGATDKVTVDIKIPYGEYHYGIFSVVLPAVNGHYSVSELTKSIFGKMIIEGWSDEKGNPVVSENVDVSITKLVAKISLVKEITLIKGTNHEIIKSATGVVNLPDEFTYNGSKIVAIESWKSGNKTYKSGENTFASDITLIASYKECTSGFVFLDENGSVLGSIGTDKGTIKTIVSDGNITLISEYGSINIADPTKYHHAFSGWFNGGVKYEFKTSDSFPVTDIMIITPEFYKTHFKVTFINSDIESVVGTMGTEITLAIPEKKGYEFIGWFVDGTEVKGEIIIVDKDITIEAKWNHIYTVSFEGIEKQPVSGIKGTEVALDKPTRNGFEFAGWFVGETKIDSDVYTINGTDVTITAKWNVIYYSDPTPVPENVNISFDVDGGSEALNGISFVKNDKYILPQYEGSKAGYIFTGWMYNGVLLNPGDEITVSDNMEIKALWAEVTIDSNENVESDNKYPIMLIPIVIFAIICGAVYYRHSRIEEN